MTRLVIGTFAGEFRGWTIVKKYRAPEHAHDDHHHHDEEPGLALKGPKPHESPWQMTLPLVVLGVLSIFAGFLSAHVFHVHPLDDWLDPVFRGAAGHVQLTEGHEGMVYPLLAIEIVVFAAGAGGAYWVYQLKDGAPALELRERFPRLYALVYDKWRIDEFYEETIIGAVEALAEFAVWFDKWVVDGILARLTSFVVVAAGTVLRYAQVGRVHAYAAVMVVGMAGFGFFVVRPRVEATVSQNHASGSYALSAAPGLGYRYRWDADGDGHWDSERFDGRREQSFELSVDQSRTVKLEVMNAFGATATREYSFTRPKPDLSAPGNVQQIEVERGPDGALRGRPVRRADPHPGDAP
jgi:NADH-quinone oxidoreductase subunit L